VHCLPTISLVLASRNESMYPGSPSLTSWEAEPIRMTSCLCTADPYWCKNRLHICIRSAFSLLIIFRQWPELALGRTGEKFWSARTHTWVSSVTPLPLPPKSATAHAGHVRGVKTSTRKNSTRDCILLQHVVAVRCMIQRSTTESLKSEKPVLHRKPPCLKNRGF
jgi:hypothetical protein